MDPFDHSLDATGVLDDGTAGVSANDEGYFGNGWDPEEAVIMPGGADGYSGGGPVGVLDTPQTKKELGPGDSTTTDYVPPEQEAQTEAHNQIIRALIEGEYAGDLDQFWVDLDSILEWDNPVWRQPEHDLPFVPPTPAIDDDCKEAKTIASKIEDNECFPPPTEARPSPCTSDDVPETASLDEGLPIVEVDDDVAPANDDVAFLTAIWNFLVENADIAEWLTCLAEANWHGPFGIDLGFDNAECIADRLNGKAPPTLILTEDMWWWCEGSSWCTHWGRHQIKIDVGDDEWIEDRDDFLTSTDPAEQLCLVTRYASVLFHEMLHSCLAIWNESFDDENKAPDPECGCDTPDMVESAFAWAIAHRYPCILDDSDCFFFGDDCMFMTPCDFDLGDPPDNCPPQTGTPSTSPGFISANRLSLNGFRLALG
jgi:hypothetical protein